MKIKYSLYLLLFSMTMSSCLVIQFGRFQKSDYHSKPKFKSNLINNDTSSIFEFHRGDKQTEERIGNYRTRFRNSITNEEDKTTLDNFLSQHTETTAFIVIRNDTILYEKYFQDYDQDSQLPSFSLAKSFTSALVGIAIEEGFINSVNDPITDYIKELKDEKGYWNELTIEHLLNMESGLNYQNAMKRPKLPYFGIGQLYIGKNAMRIIKRAKFKHSPGTKFYYSSLDTQILGIVIQRATGRSLSDLLEEKIWKKIGMHESANWSIDSKRRKNIKSYCCMEATALDYAKFGRLYLQNGIWDGESVVPSHWVRKTITPNILQEEYQYNWWLRSKYHYPTYQDSLSAVAKIKSPRQQVVRQVNNRWYVFDIKPRSFFAEGAFGQYVYIIPESNTIFVRLGKEEDIPYITDMFDRIESILPRSEINKKKSRVLQNEVISKSQR
jgi:CubicO group peptidase (beta-lactamase class C family)